jgi:hypothetical protein
VKHGVGGCGVGCSEIEMWCRVRLLGGLAGREDLGREKGVAGLEGQDFLTTWGREMVFSVAWDMQ